MFRPANCHPDRKHFAKGLCSSCYSNERAKIRRRENPEVREKARKHYAENREKIRANYREWWALNVEEMRVKQNAYIRTERGRYVRLRSKAKQLGLDCNLTFSEYQEATGKPCFYCGDRLPETGSGLDRINSDFGYVHGNVRPCCLQCNRSKTDFTEQEFREWITRVVNSEWFISSETLLKEVA